MTALLLSVLITGAAHGSATEWPDFRTRIETQAFRLSPVADAFAAVDELDLWLRDGVLDFAAGQSTAAAAAMFAKGEDDLPPALTLLVRVAGLGGSVRLRQRAHNACVAAQIMLNSLGPHPEVERVSRALLLAVDKVTNCSRVMTQSAPPERPQ